MALSLSEGSPGLGVSLHPGSGHARPDALYVHSNTGWKVGLSESRMTAVEMKASERCMPEASPAHLTFRVRGKGVEAQCMSAQTASPPSPAPGSDVLG